MVGMLVVSSIHWGRTCARMRLCANACMHLHVTVHTHAGMFGFVVSRCVIRCVLGVCVRDRANVVMDYGVR